MNENENAYDALAAADADARWAYGTGFEDPLAGVDTSVPPDVDAVELAAVCLALADDALVMSQRMQEWVSRLPELEEETAVANIALDLLGQARLLYSRAGRADGTERSEDEFAYFREQHEFRNVRLVERPNGDFADLIARLLVFSTWRLAAFEQLQDHRDPVLAAIAAKAVKELLYHRDYAQLWTTRLGDGTALSRERMSAALEAIWPYTHEMAMSDTVLRELDDVLAVATLPRPEVAAAAMVSGRSGREGVHTEALSYLLAELQSVARAHPGGTW